MNLRVLNKNYPFATVRCIVEKQMRLTSQDAEMYDNALRVVYMALDIAERYTGRHIVSSTVEVGASGFLPVMDIHAAPVNDIVSIKYIDENDITATLDPASYNLVATENSTVIEIFDIPKLTRKPRLEKVIITLQAGYADHIDDTLPHDCKERYLLPGSIEAAVQLTAGTLFEADGEAIIGRSVSQLPLTATNLLEPYRLSPYHATEI